MKTKAVIRFLEELKGLFNSENGNIALFDIIKIEAKLAVLSKDLNKKEREFVLEEIDKLFDRG